MLNSDIEQVDNNVNKKVLMTIFGILAFTMSLYQLIAVIRPTFSPVEHQAIHLVFALTLVFIWALTSKKNTLFKIIDALLLTGSVISCIYILINFDRLITQAGIINTIDVIIGTILLVVILEATRRTFGIALPILIIISILYVRFGYLFSGFFYHAGIEWPRLITSLTTNLSGVFGSILDVSATFIVLFMIFGGMLDASGAGNFFIKLSMAIGGKSRSGPAQAAVISSGLVGSINGSAVSNVATTGVFTIPLMKKAGYSPKMAASVESVASTGGMILPPVMGVGAFVMAGITGIPYIQIAIAAILPALLYYFTVSTTIHLHALKHDFKKVDDSEIPSVKETLKEGFHFLIPLIAIVYFMVSGMSVMRAGFWGVIILIAVVVIRRTIETKNYVLTQEFWNFIKEGMISGAKNAMSVAAACAAMGVVSQAFIMSGLAFKIVYFIKDLSGGMGLLALVLTMLISIFFGMGVPTTASYILVAVIGASALTELGFPLLSVHLFIFYYAILANITPPVSAAVLVASKIADSNYIKTGITAIRIGLPGFILPFLFVYHPELLLQGSPVEIIAVAISSFLGMFMLAVTFEAYFLKEINVLERIIAGIASLTLMYPGVFTDIIGYLLFGGLLASQIYGRKRLVSYENKSVM
ncbi:TRAP transporter permease [Fredinandcohnia onubensis]|uniref:TRAP transporter permease n=1 Tax=Fredinandcohnia onubensis TaxID=1571209 RepID=UPI000C0BD5CB|nr:TRAP transporter fused permease subunit [Fredinandcohnia onubensis]